MGVDISWMNEETARLIAYYLVGAEYKFPSIDNPVQLTIDYLFLWRSTPEGGDYWHTMTSYGPASNLPDECRNKLSTYLREWDKVNNNE